MRLQDLEQSGSNSRHPVQPLETPERSVAVPVGHDAPGEAQAHPRQPSERLGRRAIGINPFPRFERLQRRDRGVGLGPGRAIGSIIENVDVAGRGTGTGDQVANSLSGHGQ